MVSLSQVKIANASFIQTRPLVAVFIGGTSGIGTYAIKALAKAQSSSGKGLRAYIVGRSEHYGREVLAECHKIYPSGQFYFIKAVDLALMGQVKNTCDEIIRKEREEAERLGDKDGARIDILCMSQAIFKPFAGRCETSEGLDTYFSLLYYSRMLCIQQLLPLLLSVPSSHEARVISIFSPSNDTARTSTLNTSDLSLRSPSTCSFVKVGQHVSYLTTFYFEYLAKQYEGKLTLVHYFPGLINGKGFQDPHLPWWFRAIFTYGDLIMKVILPFYLSGEESGERVLFNAGPSFPSRPSVSVIGEGEAKEDARVGVEAVVSSDGVPGGGAYRLNWNNDIVPCPKLYESLREEGWPNKCVEHTLEVWEKIEKEGTYRD